jgi:FkbM family methyltransferase
MGAASTAAWRIVAQVAPQVFEAVVALELDVGDPSGDVGAEVGTVVRDVLSGEYDTPYFGCGLRILDLGANVGAFALWAELRWPDSRVTAYEPDPEAFALLKRNVRGRSGIDCVNAAVYPTEAPTGALVRRAGRDVEATLAPLAAEFLAESATEERIEVATVHPRLLPPADIIKLDVEGAELAILACLDLTAVSLVVLEYHDLERRRAIERLTAETFVVERVTSHPWAPYLRGGRYRRRSDEDEYGVLVLANRRLERMQRSDATRVSAARGPHGLRQACASLPRLAAAASRRRATSVRRRLRRALRSTAGRLSSR